MHGFKKYLRLSSSFFSISTTVLLSSALYAAQPVLEAPEFKESAVVIWAGDKKMPDSARQQEIAKAIYTHNDTLLHAESPFIGPKQGAVTLVVFFDYMCGHCKMMTPLLKDLRTHNPDLKIVYKEFPILGNQSTQAAKAALAAQKQGKYAVINHSLLQANHLSDEAILKIAQKAGLDMSRFKSDLESEALNQQLKANISLAQDLTIKSTPLILIINENQENATSSSHPIFFISGHVSSETLQNLIHQAQD